MDKSAIDWNIACHLDYGNNVGEVVIIEHKDGKSSVTRLASSPAKGGDFNRRSVFLGVNGQGEALILNPETKAVSASKSVESDCRFNYAYRDPGSVRLWYSNDGDENGNDTLNCGNNGATVTVASKTNGNCEVLATLLVGRGHHVSAFTRPIPGNSQIPHRAFISNLEDGTLSIVGNDPSDAITFLKVITTINLFDPRFEKEGTAGVPNNAFPHGMEFSPVTGKVYNLNNGYNSVAVIDPLTLEVERSVPMPLSSNLLLSRCGKFLIGKGVDRKAHPEHVMGRLSVLDVTKTEVSTSLEIKDFYPSVYRFNLVGDRLYVTGTSTGKGVQLQNLRNDIVQLYDSSKLPELTLIHEIQLEPCAAGRRPIAFLQQQQGTPIILIPNLTQGTLAVIDGDSHEVMETITLCKQSIEEFSFAFWDKPEFYGA